MDLLALLFPKEKKFYRMVEEQVILVGKGVTHFNKLIGSYNRSSNIQKARCISEIEKAEKQDDVLYTKMVKALKNTFITPMDREDIHRLVTTFDAIIDTLEQVSHKLAAFKITQIDKHLIEQTKLLEKAYSLVKKVIFNIKNEKEVEKLSSEIRKLENTADLVFIKAMKDLFSNSADAIKIIKFKDLYTSVERMIDRLNDSCLIIENLTVKYS